MHVALTLPSCPLRQRTGCAPAERGFDRKMPPKKKARTDPTLDAELTEACVGGGAFPGPGKTESDPCDTKEIERLVKAGASISASRAFQMAAANDQPAAIIVLHKLGGDVCEKDDHGDAPLHVAAGNLQVRTVKALLECGAPIDMPNRDGNTPLQLAAKAKREAAGFVNSLVRQPPMTAAAAATAAREEQKWTTISTLLGGDGAAPNTVPAAKASNPRARASGGQRSGPCPLCQKDTTDYPENDAAMVAQGCGAAFCEGCGEDLGCNECWVEHGSFCEGCNIFECHECERGWDHENGPTGAPGISCSACKPRGRRSGGAMGGFFGGGGFGGGGFGGGGGRNPWTEDDEDDEDDEDEDEALGRIMGWTR